ncbi:hypothetical protein [Pseudomonas fluorescens]|uniref:hypothetical protein n=1 Tax=Pseudomonas fluorescens TaxID=294 RepID=UPI00124240EF|nr:hypothetical protein [Pseudomonas fluorescens]VVN27812.1 hypothetical protein PS639_04629 [Pseudomonas fluorescens]
MYIAHYKSTKLTLLLIVLGVIFLNYVFLRPLNYPLTAAPILVLILLPLVFSITKRSLQYFIPWTIVTTFVLLKSSWDLFNIDGTQLQFFKTFSLWLFYWTFFLAVVVFPVKNHIELSRLSNTYSTLFILIFFTCFAQSVYFKLTGDSSIFNLWGGNSYSDQGYVTKVIEFGAMKTTAFYFEPAYCALVMYSILTARQIASKISYVNFPIILLGFYITGSFSGVICALLVLLTSVVFPDNHSKKYKNIKIVVGLLVFLFSFYFLADLITTRSLQIFDSTTSTYYRLIAPLEIIKNVLIDHPLGMLLGVMEDDVLKHSLSNGDTIGKTIDNGWYLLFYYFGWSGVLAFFGYITIGLRLAIKYKKGSLETYQFLLLSPFFTGAVFSPEFLFLQAIVIFTFKQRQLQ